LPDLYPFILSPPVIAKLSVIHDLVHGNLKRSANREEPATSVRDQPQPAA
jgi:hypothetical protein